MSVGIWNRVDGASSTCRSFLLLQIRCLFKTLPRPSVELRPISRHKVHLERLRLHHHTRRYAVTLDRVQLRPVPQI